jgi:hypothetical protein
MNDELKLPQVGELTLPQWQDWLVRYNAALGERERRIEKLEDALREILSLGTWGASDLARTVAREALEGKEGA